MPQRRVFGDAPQFPFYDLRDVLLDLRVIASDDLLHTIHAVGIAERGYFRDRNVRSRLPGELLPVDAWKIFCSMRSSKLSATAPTNMPCERLEIFEAGIRLSSCVLVEVVRLSLLSELEVRSCTILPKRSLNVLAVSPKT
jgi:hypothetical protein